MIKINLLKYNCLKCNKKLTTEQIRTAFRLRNRPPKYCANKCYGYNTKFLDYDNELRNYFLGLLMTDGSIKKNNVVSIPSTDFQIINDLAKEIQYKNKISIEYREDKGYKNSYSLTFSGPILQKCLKFGFPIGKKTGNEFIPNCINTKESFRHFLRGVLDGDGGFYVATDVLGYTHLSSSICCSNKKFLENIFELLKKYKIIKGSVIQKHIIYSIIFAHHDSVALGNFLYKNNPKLKLNRKYNAYILGKNLRVRKFSFNKQKGKICKIENCSKKCYAKDLCKNHYYKQPDKIKKRKIYLKQYYKKKKKSAYY